VHKSFRGFRNLMRVSALLLLGTASAYASPVLIYANNIVSPNNVSGVDGLSFTDGSQAYTLDVSFVVNSSYDSVYSPNPPTFFNNSVDATLAADALGSAFNSLGVTNIAGVTPVPTIGQTVDIPTGISQFGPYFGPSVFLASGSNQSWITSDFAVGPSTEVAPADWQSLAVFTNVTESPVPLPTSAWLLLSGIGALGVMGRRRAFS
jgi:hypothetical protein